MKLTVVGCAGSFPGPDSPASCYLVEAPFEGRTFRLVLDLGSGALGGLQRVCDLRDVDAIALSHLHADHCFDLAGFYVVSKYNPAGALDQVPVLAPRGAAQHLAAAYGVDEPAGMSREFDFREWQDGGTVRLGPFAVTAVRVDHPVDSFAIRVETGGRSLVYSGDTGPVDSLAGLVNDADVFLCEASFVESVDNPPHLHLTGADAGAYAARGNVGLLLVTHIPAWTDPAEVESDVKSTFDGPCELVTAGSTYEI